MECILYIEMNRKVPHKIVRKIDIKNITIIFLNQKITPREINSHHNYNTSTFFFSSNENLEFLVMKI